MSNINKNKRPILNKKLADKQLEWAMVDLVRSIMYGSDDNHDNWISEVEDLAKLLHEYDGLDKKDVKTLENSNRLILIMKCIKCVDPNMFDIHQQWNN
jgi:hypothetical protein